MINPIIVFFSLAAYIAGLFIVANFVERKYSDEGIVLTNNGFIYVLSLAIYATAWTFFGNVGLATSTSFLFIGVYIGPTLLMLFGRIILKKMIRIKNEFHISSVVGFIAARYPGNRSIGALASFIAIIGITPYFALQLKAIFSSVALVTTGSVSLTNHFFRYTVFIVVALLTIMFGLRRINQSERHPGMVAVVAIASLVKLVAFVGVGIFATYFIFGGFGDIFEQVNYNPVITSKISTGAPTASLWLSYIILSFFAFILLPRQFHMAVIENNDEKHVDLAAWALPLYLILITIFVFPIAMAGILKGYDLKLADLYILLIPQMVNNFWLSLMVFLGGFSAAISMLVVSTVAISTMTSNNLVLPLISSIKRFSNFKKYILQIRWAVAILILLLAYGFEAAISQSFLLVKIGMISFAAVYQFMPSVIGGIFWKKGNTRGAELGLIAGFAIWFYTSLFPAMIRSGWLPMDILNNGLFGISFLRPEKLFGISSIDPLAVTLLLSTLINGGLYIFGSLIFKQNDPEKEVAINFVDINVHKIKLADDTEIADIDLGDKKVIMYMIFNNYTGHDEASRLVNECIKKTGLDTKSKISLVQLIELNNNVEKTLSGMIGVPSARAALNEESLFNEKERGRLKDEYAKITSKLLISSSELAEKIDYFSEKEKKLSVQKSELENMVKDRTAELQKKVTEAERLNKLMLSRELKMIELKREINKLKSEKTRTNN